MASSPSSYSYTCAVCAAVVHGMPHQHTVTPTVAAALGALGIGFSGSRLCCRHFRYDHGARIRGTADVVHASDEAAWTPSVDVMYVSEDAAVFASEAVSRSTSLSRRGASVDVASTPEVSSLRVLLNAVSSTASPDKAVLAQVREAQNSGDESLGAHLLAQMLRDALSTIVFMASRSTPEPQPQPVPKDQSFREIVSFSSLTDVSRPWQLRVWTGLPDVQFLFMIQAWMIADGPLYQWKSPSDRWDSLILFFVQGYRMHSIKALAQLLDLARSTLRDHLEMTSRELERVFSARNIVQLPSDVRVLRRDQEYAKSRFDNMPEEFKKYLFVAIDGTSWRTRNAWASFDLHRLAWTHWKSYSSFRIWAITSMAGRFLDAGHFDHGKTPDSTHYAQEALPAVLGEWAATLKSQLGEQSLAIAADKGYADCEAPAGVTLFITKSGQSETEKRDETRVFTPLVAKPRMIIESSFGSLQSLCPDMVSHRLSPSNADLTILRRRFFIHMAIHNLLLDRRMAQPIG